MTVEDFRTTQKLPSEARIVREVERVVGAHRQREGGGFTVRRPVPTAGLMQVDPFLLIDEMGPVDYSPGQAVGAPDAASQPIWVTITVSLLSNLLGILVRPPFYVGLTLLYYDRRIRSEGYDLAVQARALAPPAAEAG